ncbi:hypothetical protein NDN08_003427 [Rhodosorus marinus]|uniref:MICOS complex subunit MIC60 n=1 Tax=Rhodosorus marinus TaxID=101924 RepID=A0AAV8UWP3_9RHOD|nr:hypothetical protein NDN08_003427 [Rhodosorus marinus]
MNRVLAPSILGGILAGSVLRIGDGGVAYGDRKEVVRRHEAVLAEENVRKQVIAEASALREELRSLKLEKFRELIQEKKAEEARLVHELEQRSRWEGITNEEAVRAKLIQVRELAEIEARAIQEKLSKEHEIASSAALAEILSDKEDRITSQCREVLTQISDKLEQSAETKIAEAAQSEDQAFAKAESQLSAQLEEARKSYSSSLETEAAELVKSVETREGRVAEAAEFYQTRRDAHRLCVTALKLLQEDNESAATDVRDAAIAAGAQITSVLASNVESALADAKSIPSEAELRHRFETVAQEAQKAAMIPEGRAYGALVFLLADLMSKLKIPTPSLGGEDSPGQTINSALRRCRRGDLEGAIKLVGTLSGLPKTICSDWYKLAYTRILIHQTVSTALDEASAILKYGQHPAH